MGARDLYLSWPAVSHISNFTVVVSSSEMVCVRKAAPIVLSRSIDKLSAPEFLVFHVFELSVERSGFRGVV